MNSLPHDENPFGFSKDLAQELKIAAQFHAWAAYNLSEAAHLLERAGTAGTWFCEAELLSCDDLDLSSLHPQLSSIWLDIKDLNQHQPSSELNIRGIISGAGTFAADCSTTLITSTLGPTGYPPPTPELQELNQAVTTHVRNADFTEKLGRIDPSLVAVYQQARQQLFVPGPDAGRMALSQMRQLWDHLFSRLAPDAQVRLQFRLSEDDILERGHRLEYVLDYFVPSSRKDSLKNNIPGHISSYGKLNKLHKRGHLDNEAELANARELLSIIHQWLDVIVLPAP